MTRKLQALRLTLKTGEQIFFFGPATFSEASGGPVGIDSVDLSNHFEYEDKLTLDDLWLLVQSSGSTH